MGYGERSSRQDRQDRRERQEAGLKRKKKTDDGVNGWTGHTWLMSGSLDVAWTWPATRHSDTLAGAGGCAGNVYQQHHRRHHRDLSSPAFMTSNQSIYLAAGNIRSPQDIGPRRRPVLARSPRGVALSILAVSPQRRRRLHLSDVHRPSSRPTPHHPRSSLCTSHYPRETNQAWLADSV
jgi:hypothetical protein